MLIIAESDRKNDVMWKDHYSQFEGKPEPIFDCNVCINKDGNKCKAGYKCTGSNQN